MRRACCARREIWDLHWRTLHDLVSDESKRNTRLDWMQSRMVTYFDVNFIFTTVTETIYITKNSTAASTLNHLHILSYVD